MSCWSGQLRLKIWRKIPRFLVHVEAQRLLLNKFPFLLSPDLLPQLNIIRYRNILTAIITINKYIGLIQAARENFWRRLDWLLPCSKLGKDGQWDILFWRWLTDLIVIKIIAGCCYQPAGKTGLETLPVVSAGQELKISLSQFPQ